MTLNLSSELSKVASEISQSQARTSELQTGQQKAVLGSGAADLQKQFAEFILRAMSRLYEEALVIEMTQEKQARDGLKGLATA